ncbi:hypothetical protein ScPMuIL_018261 [Solemya velum]
MWCLLILSTVLALGALADKSGSTGQGKGKGGAASSNYTVTEEVWMDVEIKDFDGPGDDYRGRLVIGVFGETCPMTTMNFINIAKGFRTGKRFLTYKNSKFHRVIPDFLVQGGDNEVGDGSGGLSIFGGTFVDENFKMSHTSAGIVSMANHGKDTNGSQFFLLLSRARWLDGKHVAFGKLVKGYDVLKTIGEVQMVRDTTEPKKTIKVVDSGVNNLEKSYTLSEKDYLKEEDL